MNMSVGTRPLRALDMLLSIARFFLYLATVLFAVLAVVGLFGSVSVSLDGTTDGLALSYTDSVDQDITVRGSSSVIETDNSTSPGVLNRNVVIPDFGRTDVTIDLEDRAPRFAALAFITVWFVLAWVAVTSVRGITRSSLDGHAFTKDNARRLGRVGWAAVVLAAVSVAMPRLMDALLNDSTLPIDGFRTSSQVSDPWLWLMVGLLFVAIGQAFERGAELEAPDAATI